MTFIRSVSRSVAIVLIFLLAISLLPSATAQSTNSQREFGLGQPGNEQNLPPGILRQQLNALPPQARGRALGWLQRFSFPVEDVASIRVDPDGSVYYADHLLPEPADNEPEPDDPVMAEAPATTLDNVFFLHSNPGSTNVVYLDFTGHVVENTAWNSSRGIAVWNAVPFDTDGNPDTFNNAEREQIGAIWHRVAEDLSYFDIDVTTEEPAVFTSTTGRVLITEDHDGSNSLPSAGGGGVAYVDVFGAGNYHTWYSPAFVYADNLGPFGETYIAEASTHEFGHNLGLSHDGTGSGVEYYGGHGSGLISWAPIMGNSYNRNVTEWSIGEYADANNTQDDLNIIDGKLSYLLDDHGDTYLTASALELNPPPVLGGTSAVSSTNPEFDPLNAYIANKGVIHSGTDVDVFGFASAAGNISLTVNPAWEAWYNGASRRAANLDVSAELFDDTGSSVAVNQPVNDTTATVSATVSAGTYFLAVTGVATGDGSGDGTNSNYSQYNSMGKYFISGSVPSTVTDLTPPPAPTWNTVPVAASETSISMSVNAVTDADSPPVEYNFACVSGGQWCIDSGWQAGTSHVATGLAPDTTYTYQVTARDQVGNESSPTSTLGATTPMPTPTGLVAVATFPDTIELSWSDYPYSEDGFILESSPDGSSWSALASPAADATSYDHTGLGENTTVYYRIRADRGASSSGWSAVATATTPYTAGTFTFPIVTGNDDVEEFTAPVSLPLGYVWLNSTNLNLGLDSSNGANDEGLRFQDVTVPQGAIINNAYIEFTAKYSHTGSTSINLMAEDSDDAAAYNATYFGVSSRTYGSSVAWSLGNWTSGQYYQTSELKSLVQVVVDRSGWSGGNNMAFMMVGDHTSNHIAHPYESSAAQAARLVINYLWSRDPLAPTASFTYSTYSLDATFTDTSTDSDGSVVAWDWDFGDGNASTLQYPVHTYASSGTYTVGLTVTDNDAETGSTIQSVTVVEDTTAPLITTVGDNPAFVDQFETYTDAGATATDDLDGDLTSSISTTGLPVDTNTPGDVTVNYSVADGSGNVGSADRTVTIVANQSPTARFSTSNMLLQVTFTDTSTDSDGTVVDWSWGFGDGNTSMQQSPVHSYASYNTYTVTLTVTDDDGATDVYATSVEVAPDQVVPVITLLGATPDSIGQYDTYTEPGFTASDDIDGDITGSVTVGGWDYDTSIAGVKTLTYDVADASGNNAIQKTRDVTVVANQDPVANFIHSISGLSVDFTDLSSDSDGSVDAWSWDFGDSGSSTNQNPTHVYATDGNYTVTLTVTDDDGHTDQASDSFTLISPPNGLAATPEAIDFIVLTWNDNSTAETGFEIERSPGGAGTWANIGTVTPGVATFTDSDDLTDGSDYDYRARATGPDGDSAYSATASVTSFECALGKTYNAGEWYQFALACDPGPYNTMTHIFDGPHPLLYRWDANAMSYVRLGPSDTLTPQMGYWVNFYYTTSYTQSGYDNINTDIPLVTDSFNGRSNLVGFHGTGTISWPDVRVIDGAQVKTLLEADPWENGSNPTNRVCDLATPTSKCLMSRKLRIWGGTKAAGSYQIYDPDVPGQEGSLVPLDGLWVDAFKSGVELRLPDPAAPAPTVAEIIAEDTAETASAKQKHGKGNKGGNKGGKNDGPTWYMRLIAESGALRDPGNTLGQKAGSIDGQDSRDLEEPAPFLGDFLSVLFTNPLFETVDWGFTTDFREPTDLPTGEWPFVVRTSKTTSSITLSWKADDYDFTSTWLTDEQTGERIAITANGSYTFQPAGEESRFVIVIE